MTRTPAPWPPTADADPVVGVLGDGLPHAVGEAIPVRGRWMVGATAEVREWARFAGARAVPAGAVARDGSLPKFRCSDVLMSRPTGTHIGISTL